MRWKIKAKIQKAVSLLPSSASYVVYYWIQRHFGGLKQFDTIRGINAAIRICQQIQEQGETPSGKTFFEVGTGRVPLVPLAYWLMGAEKTITMDLNPYLKAELLRESLQYISNNNEKILNLFGSLVDKQRFSELLALSRDPELTVSSLLDLCRVEYIAPGDATDTRLPDQSIDFHTSWAVFEHIPSEVLKQILKEGNRIIKNSGLFIHVIDYSDHFSYSDNSISPINFLQYSDDEWDRIAGNRYMYMNRLRHDDVINLFESVGHHIIKSQANTDKRLQELLRNGSLQLDKRFYSKSEDMLAIKRACLVSQKKVD